MKMLIVALLALLISSQPGHAQQKKMRDFSMPIDESLRQPSSTGISNFKPLSNTGFPSSSGGLIHSKDDMPMSSPAGTAKHYMEGYCDPSFTPVLSRNTALHACLTEKKEKSCSQFNRQPKDVRKVINLAVDCAYAESETMNEDGQQQLASPAGCDTVSDARLKMVKKYRDNEDTIEALTVLPDEVLTETATCMGGR